MTPPGLLTCYFCGIKLKDNTLLHNHIMLHIMAMELDSTSSESSRKNKYGNHNADQDKSDNDVKDEEDSESEKDEGDTSGGSAVPHHSSLDIMFPVR